MLKAFWQAGPSDQVTPKASAQANPFDSYGADKARIASSPAGSRKNSFVRSLTGGGGGARTPTHQKSSLLPIDGAPGPSTPGASMLSHGISPAPATTALSTAEPNFNFSVNPATLTRKTGSGGSAGTAGSGGRTVPASPTVAQPPTPAASAPAADAATPVKPPANAQMQSLPRGKLYVKLIEARGLAAASHAARPYVVASFDQSEFVSREALDTDESEKSDHAPRKSDNGTSTPRLETAPGPSASGLSRSLEAYRISEAARASNGNGLGQSSPAYNPVWRHEVIFDVTSDLSEVQLSIFDRSTDDEQFLGVARVRPRSSQGQTVESWLKLQPRGSEPTAETVTGELRIQYRYERLDTGKRSLTVRDFDFLRMIGKGTFGRVFQVRKRDTKRIYAMKVLSKKEVIAKKEVVHTMGERRILERGSECAFLLGLKFSFQSNNELFFVMDYQSGGELFHHLQREGHFHEDRARFYTAEIVLAFEHLHKYDIVYRDLKPENILLDATGHIVLCDFGLSKPDLPSDALTTTFCGTTEYLAPEVLLDEHGYSKLVDFWSLGVLLFEMCTGWSPFYAEDTQQMYKNICFGKIKFPKNVLGDDGKQFVKGLLNRNPKHRLGAQRDAAELKEHPFFKLIDWVALAAREVSPPFKPYVESDESVANFDAEFTEADLLKEAPRPEYDDDDPSADWLRDANGSDPTSRPVDIKAKPNGRGAHKGSPLTNSVQDAFLGFSFAGESTFDVPSLRQ